MPRWSLRRQLNTANLCFNCDDLLSVQSHSPGGASDSALNSDSARVLGGLSLGTDASRDVALEYGCREVARFALSRMGFTRSPAFRSDCLTQRRINCWQPRGRKFY